MLFIVPARGADSAEENVAGLLFRKLYFVDLGIETVVVGTQGVQHGPYHLEVGVAFENLVALGIGRNHDGDDDVSVFLAFAAAHDAADRLHDIDLRIFGRDEYHCIERRHVDTLRETAGIGENAAFAFVVGLCLEPHQFLVASGGRHGAVDVVGNDIDHRGPVLLAYVLHVELLACGEGFGSGFRVPDARAESHGAAHRQRVGTLDELLVGTEHLLGECIDAAYEFRGIVGRNGVAAVGNGILQHGRNIVFAHGKDEYLVV